MDRVSGQAPGSPHRFLQPKGWPRAKGYANGILARGEMVFVGGMVGADGTGRFADGFIPQMQALADIVAVLAEAGIGGAHRSAHLVRARHARISCRSCLSW